MLNLRAGCPLAREAPMPSSKPSGSTLAATVLPSEGRCWPTGWLSPLMRAGRQLLSSACRTLPGCSGGVAAAGCTDWRWDCLLPGARFSSAGLSLLLDGGDCPTGTCADQSTGHAMTIARRNMSCEVQLDT